MPAILFDHRPVVHRLPKALRQTAGDRDDRYSFRHLANGHLQDGLPHHVHVERPSQALFESRLRLRAFCHRFSDLVLPYALERRDLLDQRRELRRGLLGLDIHGS